MNSRRRILDVARHLFAEHTVGATPLSHIAREAGVSTALIVKLFHTKANLFAATLDFRPSAEALFAGPFAQLGSTAVRATLTTPFSAPHSTIRVITVAGGSDELMYEIGKRIKADLLSVLARRIRNEAPGDRPSPALRSQSAFAVLQGLSLMRRIGDTEFHDIAGPELEDHYATVVQRILDGHPPGGGGE